MHLSGAIRPFAALRQRRLWDSLLVCELVCRTTTSPTLKLPVFPKGSLKDFPATLHFGTPTRSRRVTEDCRLRRTRPASLASALKGVANCPHLTGSGAVIMLALIGMEPQCANRIANSWREIAQRNTPHV